MDRSGVGRIVQMPNAARDLAQLRARHVQPGTPCAMALQYRSMRWPSLARTWPRAHPALPAACGRRIGRGRERGRRARRRGATGSRTHPSCAPPADPCCRGKADAGAGTGNACGAACSMGGGDGADDTRTLPESRESLRPQTVDGRRRT